MTADILHVTAHIWSFLVICSSMAPVNQHVFIFIQVSGGGGGGHLTSPHKPQHQCNGTITTWRSGFITRSLLLLVPPTAASVSHPLTCHSCWWAAWYLLPFPFRFTPSNQTAEMVMLLRTGVVRCSHVSRCSLLLLLLLLLWTLLLCFAQMRRS